MKANQSTFFSVLSKLTCTPSNTSAILFAQPALSKYGFVDQIWKIAVVFKEAPAKKVNVPLQTNIVNIVDSCLQTKWKILRFLGTLIRKQWRTEP